MGSHLDGREAFSHPFEKAQGRLVPVGQAERRQDFLERDQGSRTGPILRKYERVGPLEAGRRRGFPIGVARVDHKDDNVGPQVRNDSIGLDQQIAAVGQQAGDTRDASSKLGVAQAQ